MAKEEWQLCADWLVNCQLLAPDHRVIWPNAQVFDLAQVLRDGVLICHLLNRLRPGAIDPKDFSQRPQMSQVRNGIKLYLSCHLRCDISLSPYA
ncbi:hypothetical protein CAPTEDRAFT_122362 [Capitella teleta]|uniref:Calponin-homology (CH) domain-containing protein n=1 Tax=Capitella teleta TaxID=283909 RepID=R7U650_CAPTE|nr:hypothetical protein CAPTEDRAFT_122362 [Capitella teleta]|eukprot:ELU01581.1 hypothetical protein CAPTEDRAFT_122362 [Capitella teleta]